MLTHSQYKLKSSRKLDGGLLKLFVGLRLLIGRLQKQLRRLLIIFVESLQNLLGVTLLQTPSRRRTPISLSKNNRLWETVLVPKLRLGNADLEAPASSLAKLELRLLGSQAGAWEPE